MSKFVRWRRHWPYAAGMMGLALVSYQAGQQLGRARPLDGVSARRPAALVASATEALRAEEDEEFAPEVESIVLAQKKRIMGRLKSLEHVRRVATEIRPLVERALEQPEIQADLRALAREAGMSLAEYKRYFAGKQEADLLLESGGDPNARSVSDAIGVAQFLAGTGRRCGLRIDEAASEALSRRIRALEAEIEALAARPAEWSRPVPAALRGVIPTLPSGGKEDASLVPAAGRSDSGVWTRDQWLAYRERQCDELMARRRRVDERYDPARAIEAQTKYLVALTRRYGGIDWALQAYHGGEGGAARTMRLFAASGAVHPRLASRAGFTLGGVAAPGRRWLPYTEVYRRITPSAAPAAFSYLFGRSDDHRYYWWKVLMAERALNLYRKDPEEFERQWRALQPGLSADAVWYPEPAELEFADDDALRAAYREGALVPLPPNAGALGLRTQNLAALAPESTMLHKGLRPEAMGALLRLAQLYRSHGGREPLTLVGMVHSAAYCRRLAARYPDPPLPPEVPKDPEFHAMGVTFDLKPPAREWDRKVLEFALGRLYDTRRVSWRKETEAGSRRYHVVVNPEFREELAGHYRQLAAR